ncbi:carbon-nitrogen family hydrolase [Evansella cellulosilytica]|uniref:Nitrilase/cyanide hydratase and apolipoprotein N-acyltransferase n=1 Tax=Evansella cellulosilytica (strain ATCC 21833 / DSM 2522 / FERM P-1141 / JCM 9156 / N-4) TaxID=649639 RepID=E6TYZ4_EVAC2|nr:carbon-nitrogen family hydrolase [Evansella cellulosilytica]ADU32437.1 Nitrilase/cyanide hydratase and apolipoprotein N-acyltransferase [Evansella cellulosilytica DSM 2522]
MQWKVAMIQMDIAFGDIEKNIDIVKQKVKEAMKEAPDVIVLPELWTTGYDLARLKSLLEHSTINISEFLSKLAKGNKVHILAGSIAQATDAGITNIMLIFNNKGELVKEYSKAHLFRLMDEEKYLVQGNKDGLFSLNNIDCAGVICYDIRFPEWIRTHMIDQAKVLFVVAEWPKARIDHWRALLMSRAIENQCYVIACNRVGADPNNEFGGNSMIIGPWGEVVSEAGDKETIIYGEVDLLEVDKVRETIPIYSDRRTDLYKL